MIIKNVPYCTVRVSVCEWRYSVCVSKCVCSLYCCRCIWVCVRLCCRDGGEIALPIKRCPCCNQCTEALGPICCNINLELMKVHNTQTHRRTHIQTHFLPTVLTLRQRDRWIAGDTHEHPRMHLNTRIHTHAYTQLASKPANQAHSRTLHTLFSTQAHPNEIICNEFSCFSFFYSIQIQSKVYSQSENRMVKTN